MSDTPNLHNASLGPSYGRQMREQIAGSQDFDHKKVSEHLTQVLGFVATQHKDAIIADLFELVSKDYQEGLDGYVLALSRCMEYDLAWHCISEAFQHNKKTIPDKYYRLFNKNRKEDESPPPTMSVE